MQGLLETPGLTVAGHLGHGQVIEAPMFLLSIFKIKLLETFPQDQEEQRQKQLDVSFF
jgi:hypothetical protein